MFIARLTVKNYKSFNTEQSIELTSGINVITGQNNSGKTALLEALGLNFQNHPHRSSKTVPKGQEASKSLSSVKINFWSSRKDLTNYILSRPSGQAFLFPMAQNLNLNSQGINLKQLIDFYFHNEVLTDVTYNPSGQMLQSSFKSDQSSVGDLYRFFVDVNRNTVSGNRYGGNQDSSNEYSEYFKKGIYSFKAERLKVGICYFGKNSVLSSDASNLPEVLNILQSDPKRFQRFNDYVRKVLPQIFQITVRPSSTSQNNEVEIVVWNESPELERADLAIPLIECGTG